MTDLTKRLSDATEGTREEALVVSDFVGLKCDAPDCSWSDMSITRAQYPDYRNKPCPSCGSNLLTDEDWAIVLCAEAAAAWVSDNAELLGLTPGEPREVVEVDFDALKAMIERAKATDTGVGG